MYLIKRSALAAACTSLLALGASLSANAALVIDGGANQSLPIVNNSFNTQLSAAGFDQMASGAQLRVDQNGFIDFYYIGAESGFNNSFTAQGSSPGDTLAEHNEGFNFAGYGNFTIAVSANDVVNFSFNSDAATALQPVDNASGSNLQGLGIYFNSSQNNPLLQVLLGYDDQTVNDDNDFEDMLIRADFRPSGDNVSPGSPVPLPAAIWLFGAGLTGLAGFARRAAKPQ